MELWDARYADGSLAGSELVRGEDIPEGLYHLVVEIFVRHVDGTHLLMQRDLSKDGFPGFYEPGASGSVLKGETPIEAAKRELFEETGIEGTEFVELFHTHYRQVIFITYSCVTDWPKDGIDLQEGETMSYRWVSQAEFLDWYHHGDVIPFQKERLASYIASLT